MKKLSKSLHRSLKVQEKDEAKLKFNRYWSGSNLKSQMIHISNRIKLCRRGYLVYETRQTSPTSWSFRMWISEKGKRYLRGES